MNTSDAAKTIVITGAARGIGREIARALQGTDRELVLLDVDGEGLETLRAELGDRASAHVVDLRDRAACDRWMEGLRSQHARIDAIVLNAGAGGPDGMDDAEALRHLDHVVEVNATAVMRLIRGLAVRVPKDGSGRIVVVASILGRMGVADFAAYCASKAAVIGLVRAVALELAPFGITVNAICPGWTDTPMAQQGFEAIAAATGVSAAEARARVERDLPLGRIVRPDEVAALAAYLLSPAAGALTGQSILISAGDLQR